ncbi:MAG: hypothetical protein NVSMB32_15620 [Actinomycetota bacterium]
MGETADQTAAEIAALRTQMSARVDDLRQDVERKGRELLPVILGVAGVGGALGSLFLYFRHRKKKRERKARRTIRRFAKTLAEPGMAMESLLAMPVRQALQVELLEDHKEPEPLTHKLLQTAVKSAMAAAVPIVLQALWEGIAKSQADEVEVVATDIPAKRKRG